MAEGRTAFALAEDDWMLEPLAATELLLARESFADMTVLDPCCGQGNIVKTLRAHGEDAYGPDLRWRGLGMADGWIGPGDFLAPGSAFPPGCAAIVMNPPYGRAKLADAFIRKAVTTPGVLKVAAFVNGKFIFGSGRAQGLYTGHPPSRAYPIAPRPSCPPGEALAAGLIKAEGGVENYVWLVWDRTSPA